MSKQSRKNWAAKHPEAIRIIKSKSGKKYQLVHAEEISLRKKKYYILNRNKIIKRKLIYRQKLRLDVLSHYSNGELKCACCGEECGEFLGIDHINGGGNKHRRQIGAGSLYRWLRLNNYPTGYRVLCYNCNHVIGTYGYCPHQTNQGVVGGQESV